MIELTYLGALRKDLNIDKEDLEWQSSLTDVSALIEFLSEARGEQWSETLHQDQLLVSVNQKMVKTDCPLGDGDKVIFFPPMSGG